MRTLHTRKFQSEPAIYGAGYCRTSRDSLSKMHANPIIPEDERSRVLCSSIWCRSYRIFLFSPPAGGDDDDDDSRKRARARAHARTILSWATNYEANHRVFPWKEIPKEPRLTARLRALRSYLPDRVSLIPLSLPTKS